MSRGRGQTDQRRSGGKVERTVADTNVDPSEREKKHRGADVNRHIGEKEGRWWGWGGWGG